MAGAVSENNMADQFNATQAGTMSPEDYAQQQLINRQQRFADMLMQQNQQPQGQMVSGRYVAPSFFQMLNPVANMLAGAYVGKQSDTEAAKLAEKIRSGRATAEEKITNLALGTPEVPAQPAVIPKGQTLRDDNGMPKSIVGKMFFHEHLANGSNVTLAIKHLSDIDDNRGFYIIKTSFTEFGKGYIAYKDEEIK